MTNEDSMVLSNMVAQKKPGGQLQTHYHTNPEFLLCKNRDY